jgi:hypothetical protein
MGSLRGFYGKWRGIVASWLAAGPLKGKRVDGTTALTANCALDLDP